MSTMVDYPRPMPTDDEITVAQAAKLRKVSRDSVLLWCKQGLAHRRIGKVLIVMKREDVEGWERKPRGRRWPVKLRPAGRPKKKGGK